jgi:D-alanyl-lipoteichoic acid acyltransferase DltB (MBOAT superfamily)
MVFSSLLFIFAFVPVTLAGFWLCSRISPYLSKIWLCAASIVFYGWWDVKWIPVLLVSIIFNYLIASLMIERSRAGRQTNILLFIGVSLNLAALIYYKYIFWLFGVAGLDISWGSVGLPLGISFFTFTQIAFLVDVSQGMKERYDPVNYLLFVTFFPHLIAGPIVHHRDLMPQFEDKRNYSFQPSEFAVGLAIFSIGLAKKTLLADNLAEVSSRMLDGGNVGPAAAWAGAITYSLQLYFDFSGYSDMAIGLARMFGVKFPLNFDSPYKATSIIDFWQRWHITLTRFLTAYVYNPLALALVRARASRGLSTSKKASQTIRGFLEMIALPTCATMVIAGVWHGAGLQFLVFGALHGAYISINHAWRTFGFRGSQNKSAAFRFSYAIACGALVYLCVLVAQIFFRATSFDGAISVLGDMMGLHAHAAFDPVLLGKDKVLAAAAILIVLFAPNTQEIMARFGPALDVEGRLRPTRLLVSYSIRSAIALGVILFLGLHNIQENQPFIYFQF